MIIPPPRATYYDRLGRGPTARQQRDEDLKTEIRRVYDANYRVYGARKVWLALNREGITVARCTVERLMAETGLAGARRGTRRRTTVADPAAVRPADLVRRRFAPLAPDRLWVADLTYVSTWSGWAYVAFVIDAYARAHHRLAGGDVDDHHDGARCYRARDLRLGSDRVQI